jgi:glutathione synthase/RimK-type ligase-like ATP-grasp enzyme/MFS family permease
VPPVPSPVLLDVFEILRRRGHEIESAIVEETLFSPERLRVEHDLYVLKSHTELSLSVAGVLDAQGARMLNPYRSCTATQDKIVAARRLRAAGVPAPRAWVTGDLSLLSSVAEETPLVVKPHRGHRGAGITVVRDPPQLAAIPRTDTPLLAQEYVEGGSEDVKVYVVGDQVFAVRKPFSEMSFTLPGRPSPVSDELRRIALAAGRALGLGLYGLDVIETDAGPVVVDVNYFPGYKGVPNVAPLIAEYIDGYARGRHRLVAPRVDDTRPILRSRGDGALGRIGDGLRARIGRINPSLAAIIAEGFLSRLSFGFITFALPLYAFREFGLGLTEVGLLLALNVAVAVLLKPFTGRLADRFGMRPSFITAIGLRSLVPLGLAVAALPWHLFALRAAHGVSISLRDPAASVLIAEHGGERAVASAFAWYQTAKSVAGALGKAAAGLLLTLTASSFAAVFLVAFVLSALPMLVLLRYVSERSALAPSTIDPDAAAGVAAQAAEDRIRPEAPAQEAARPSVLPFIGLGFLVSGTAYMLTNLFPIFATEYAGLTDAQAGAVYVVAMAAGFSGPIFGWLSDNVSRRLVLSVRTAANVLSSLIYLLAPSFAGLIVGHAIDDTGKAAFRPAWGALMAHVASFDRRRRGRTFGSISAGEDAGEMAGPVLAGFLWSMWGVPVLLAVRIALAVATEAYAIALVHSLERRRAPAGERRTMRAHRRHETPTADL